MNIAVHRLLTLQEISAVIADLSGRIARHDRLGHRLHIYRARVRLMVFLLSACCGLRRKEIILLELDDVTVNVPKPIIVIRKNATKGSVRDIIRKGVRTRRDTRKARFVPLYWSQAASRLIADYKKHRLFHVEGSTRGHRFIVSEVGNPIGRNAADCAWKQALRGALGVERAKQVRLHDGRHGFASHALQAGHSLAAVRDALGHSDISMTSHYLHSFDSDDVPDMFAVS